MHLSAAVHSGWDTTSFKPVFVVSQLPSWPLAFFLLQPLLWGRKGLVLCCHCVRWEFWLCKRNQLSSVRLSSVCKHSQFLCQRRRKQIHKHCSLLATVWSWTISALIQETAWMKRTRTESGGGKCVRPNTDSRCKRTSFLPSLWQPLDVNPVMHLLAIHKGPLMFTRQIICGHVTLRPPWPAVAGGTHHKTAFVFTNCLFWMNTTRWRVC